MLACCCANSTEEVFETATQHRSDVTAETIETKFQPTIKVLPFEEGPLEAPSFGPFEVVIPTKDFSTLGLEIDKTEPSRPMVMEIKEGAIQSFNEIYPGSGMQVYDVLTALDEAEGCEAIENKMTGELPEKMTFRVKRPKKVEIKFQKTGLMGLKLNYSTKSTGAIVESLDSSGLVGIWNSQHLSDAIGLQDRVIEFNGQVLTGQELVDRLKNESDIKITVLKYWNILSYTLACPDMQVSKLSKLL